MKNSIATFYILFAVISTSCFAINFGPGPGGGGNHDTQEKINIQEDGKELLAEDEEVIPLDPKEVKKS